MDQTVDSLHSWEAQTMGSLESYEQRYLAANAGACGLQFWEVLQVASP